MSATGWWGSVSEVLPAACAFPRFHKQNVDIFVSIGVPGNASGTAGPPYAYSSRAWHPLSSVTLTLPGDATDAAQRSGKSPIQDLRVAFPTRHLDVCLPRHANRLGQLKHMRYDLGELEIDRIFVRL